MEQMTHNGVTLAFEDAGKGAPPILLIHDAGSDHASLRTQFEHFRCHHRVVAVDLPGHDASLPVATPYTPANLADELAWLCYELGVYRPVVAGHGVGGMVAVELTVRFPDLLAAVVIQDTPLVADARACADSTAAPARLFETRKNAMDWNGAAALARCRVPILCIQTGTVSIDADRLCKLSPYLTVESVRSGYSGRRETTIRVNAVIDAFLTSVRT